LLILQDGRNYKNIEFTQVKHAGYTDDAVEARASQVVASRSETAPKGDCKESRSGPAPWRRRRQGQTM